MSGARHSFKTGQHAIPQPTPFAPTDLAAVTAWLRLSDATIVSSDVSVLPDFINSNPAVQTVAARRPTLALSTGNGVRVMTFATNDCLSWPIGTGNNGLDQKGFAGWCRIGSSGGMLWSVSNGTLGASAKQTQLQAVGGSIAVNNFISGSNGRQGSVASAYTAGIWVWLRTMYDSSQSTEATKAKFYVNRSLQTLSFTNLGSGGTLGTLPSVTGNMLLGNQNNGTASSPFSGDFGPNFYVLNADLTAAQELSLMNFERPT